MSTMHFNGHCTDAIIAQAYYPLPEAERPTEFVLDRDAFFNLRASRMEICANGMASDAAPTESCGVPIKVE